MSSTNTEDYKTDVIFVTPVPAEESSEDPPMEDWSSLEVSITKENQKKKLQAQGLYDPGSGEICTKYISMSASSVFRNPYYKYPAVLDPGIKEALLDPEKKKIYADDGQQKYMDICNEMGQCPVTIFYKGLITDSINLKYYCVDPFGVRPMAMALSHNRTVTSLDLTDNFLNDDACSHLGELLTLNSTLEKLNLSGCRIGSSGARHLFLGLSLNRGLKSINLSENQLGDLGIEYLADAVGRGIDVGQICLSHNSISGKSANLLAEALDINNKFTHIDLSWNNLYAPIVGTVNLFSKLARNNALSELNVSWNSLSGGRIGSAIGSIFSAPNLKLLDISNNKLSGEAIDNLIGNLKKAKKLLTLNVSFNPMTPEDALAILLKMKLKSVKIQNLLLENVFVNGAFLRTLEDIKKKKANLVVKYGGIIGGFKPIGPDMRDLVLNRVEFLNNKGKKRNFDIALFAMQLLKDNYKMMDAKSFGEAIEAAGAFIDSDLIDEIVNAFPGVKTAKSKRINISLLVEYIQRKWPERKLPPTPPPTPPPEPESEPEPVVPDPPTNKKKKGKK